jgi:hypothetical protein
MADLSDTTSDIELIQRIVKNNIKPYFPAAVNNFMRQDWQTLLVKLNEEVGMKDFAWREAVRQLRNLALYVEPATQQNYPRVESEWLPDLLEKMRSQLSTAGIESQFIDNILATNVVTVADNTIEQTNAQLSESDSDDSVLEFNLSPDDIPDTSAGQTPVDIDRGNRIDFEPSRTETRTAKTDEQIIPVAKETDDEALDLEPFEIDISDQDINEDELAELEQELTNFAQQAGDEMTSADDLPPLELDLSDFVEDSEDPKLER